MRSRGHEYGKPVATMRAYLDAIDGHDAAGGAPLVLAALRPRMLELARDRAAGAHPYFVPVEHTARARATLGDGPLLAPEVTAVLEPEAGRARARARAFMERYLAPSQLPQQPARARLRARTSSRRTRRATAWSTTSSAWGDAAAVAERVRAHRDAGADHVCVQMLADEPAAAVRQLRALAPLVL